MKRCGGANCIKDDVNIFVFIHGISKHSILRVEEPAVITIVVIFIVSRDLFLFGKLMSQCDGLIVCQIGDQFCIDVIAAEASGRLDQFIAGNLVIIPVGASSEITELLQTECCTESVAAAARY